MSGFGFQPFGSSGYSIGTPSVAPIPGGAVLRDLATNASTGSRRIDPETRDYVVDRNGRTLGMDDVQHLVLMAVQTARNSSAMANFGQRLGDIDVIGDGIERQVRTVFEDALAHLTSRKLIEIVSVTVTRLHPGALRAKLQWRDAATRLEHTSEI